MALSLLQVGANKNERNFHQVNFWRVEGNMFMANAAEHVAHDFLKRDARFAAACLDNCADVFGGHRGQGFP